METFAQTRKFWAALIGAGATAMLGIFAPDTVWWKLSAILAAMATAATVYGVKNEPMPKETPDEHGRIID